MTRPGNRLRRIASLVFSAPAMKHVIDPAIADIQCEYADAMCAARPWRARRVRILGYVTLAKAVGVMLALAIAPFALVTTGVTALLILVPLAHMPAGPGREPSLSVVLFLIPQALAVALPVGLLAGLWPRRARTCGRLSRAAILSVLIGGSLMALINVGWITPAANQAYREQIIGRPIPRGVNELNLGELRAYAMTPNRSADLNYHERLTLAVAPLLLGLLALSAATTSQRFLPVAALVVFVSCYALFQEETIRGLIRWVPAFVIVWFPNGVIAVAAILSRFQRTRPADQVESMTGH